MEELKEFGLSEHEISIYLTLLKTERTTANRLAALTDMKRSTTYDTLQALLNKGIVSKTVEGKTTTFQAAEPRRIVELLEEKKNKIERILPALENMKAISSKPSGVTYFEGKKGVVTVLNDIFKVHPKKLFFIGSRKQAKIPLRHYPDNFVRKRVDEKIFAEGFLADEDKSDEFVTKASAEKYSAFQYRKILNGIAADIFIYNDKISFITNKEDPAGIIINNAEIAATLLLLFEHLKDK
jgi:sugar-specific transcriptional regulator TrmB